MFFADLAASPGYIDGRRKARSGNPVAVSKGVAFGASRFPIFGFAIFSSDEYWAVVDLVGKARHMRTVPIPDWVKAALREWTEAAGITDGRLFRCVCRVGTIWGQGITEKGICRKWLSANRAGRSEDAL